MVLRGLSSRVMTVPRLWVERYRSLVKLRIDLYPVTVIQGENATGKTNLYRVLLLLSRGASGALAQTLLGEGGMPSALWAAPHRTGARLGSRARPVTPSSPAGFVGVANPESRVTPPPPTKWRPRHGSSCQSVCQYFDDRLANTGRYGLTLDGQIGTMSPAQTIRNEI